MSLKNKLKGIIFGTALATNAVAGTYDVEKIKSIIQVLNSPNTEQIIQRDAYRDYTRMIDYIYLKYEESLEGQLETSESIEGKLNLLQNLSQIYSNTISKFSEIENFI